MIGVRLRELREATGLSLRSLATQSGFSASFLSQVELGQSSPSLSSLQRICAALGADLADVLKDLPTADASPVIRPGEREALRSEWSRASAASLVARDAEVPLSALMISIDPAGRTGPLRRVGIVLQFAYCMRGRVTLSLRGMDHPMRRGDSTVIRGNDPFAFENRGRNRAEILLVSVREAGRKP